MTETIQNQIAKLEMRKTDTYTTTDKDELQGR